jgi:hypothetical protein
LNCSTVTFNNDSDVISNTVAVEYAKLSIDLGLQLNFSPDFVQAGGHAVLSATVTNYGIASESNPILKLTIPPGLKSVGGWPAGCSQSGTLLECNGQAFGVDDTNKLKPGKSADLPLNVATATGHSQYQSFGHVRTSSVEGDPNMNNNFAEASLGANHPPIAMNATMHAIQSGPAVQLDISPFVSDRDGDSLHFSYSPPNVHYGKVRLSATTFTFQPTSHWHGAFQFSYRVRDGRGGWDTAIIKVLVASQPRNQDSQNPSGGGSTTHHGCRGFVHAGC